MLVFLDLDGVLADFAAGVARLFGVDKDLVVKFGDRSHEAVGLSQSEFWRRLYADGQKWWVDLPPYPWAARLVEACDAAGEAWIATSPPKDCTTVGGGKLEWLKRFVPEVYKNRRYFIGSRKHILAAPGRVLVDDNLSKCEDFRRAGGQAVLFPQPWNGGSDGDQWRLVESIENGEFPWESTTGDT